MVRPRQSRILVIDVRRGAAVATIRSLARYGCEVIAADSDPGSPGLFSRDVSSRLLYTCPTQDPRKYAEEILQAVEQFDVDLLIPVTEQALLPLETIRERVEQVCRVPWAPIESMQTVRDKNRTFQLAKQLAIPFPQSHLVHTAEEAMRVGAELGWPVVMKPSSSTTMSSLETVQSWSVTYARNLKELRDKMREFEGHCPVLLQEYFVGFGVGVEILAHEGRPISAFQHRRLREVPVTGGVSSLRCSVPLSPELYAQTRKLIEALQWTGLAMVEFKQNDQGETRLMEINGRIWGSLPLAIESGMDFPAQLCDLMLHGPPDDSANVKTDYRVGVHVQNFQKELSWIVQVLTGAVKHPVMKVPPRRAVLGAIFDLLKPHYRFDILSVRDPQPGLRMLLNLARRGRLSRPRQAGSDAIDLRKLCSSPEPSTLRDARKLQQSPTSEQHDAALTDESHDR